MVRPGIVEDCVHPATHSFQAPIHKRRSNYLGQNIQARQTSEATCQLWPEADFASYSMISSARERSEGGTVRPSALAVLRLITNSNLVAFCTGRSAGFFALKDAIDVASGLPALTERVRSVGDQDPISDQETGLIARRQSVSRRQRDDPIEIVDRQRACGSNQAAIRSARKFGYSLFDVSGFT